MVGAAYNVDANAVECVVEFGLSGECGDGESCAEVSKVAAPAELVEPWQSVANPVDVEQVNTVGVELVSVT